MTHTRTVALLSGLILSTLALASGCGWSNAHSRGLKLWNTDHNMYRFKNYPFVPGNAVGQAPSECDCPTYFAEPPFFGYHDTCWRRWPEGWEPCPTEPVTEVPAEAVESPPEPSPADQDGEPSVVVPKPPVTPPKPSAEAKPLVPMPQPAQPPQEDPLPEKSQPAQTKPAEAKPDAAKPVEKPQPQTPAKKTPPAADQPAKPPASATPKAVPPQDRSLPSVPSLFDRESRQPAVEREPRVSRASYVPPHREMTLRSQRAIIPSTAAPAAIPGVAKASQRLHKSLIERIRLGADSRDANSGDRLHKVEAHVLAKPIPEAAQESTPDPAAPQVKARVLPVTYPSTGSPATLPPIKAKPIPGTAAQASQTTKLESQPVHHAPAVVIDADRLRRGE